MILECNLAVFISQISGNRYRICSKFRIKIGISNTNAQMDWRDDKQIKMPGRILTCFSDYLIKSFCDYTGGCSVAGFTVIRAEHDDHEVNWVMHLYCDSNQIQSAAALTQLILKDSCSAAKSLFYNVISRSEFFL